jgi:hypothetical protein
MPDIGEQVTLGQPTEEIAVNIVEDRIYRALIWSLFGIEKRRIQYAVDF